MVKRKPHSELLKCWQTGNEFQYAISQLRIVRSGLHLVTYLDVGNFCDKRTETNLHENCVQVYLIFSIPPSQANPYP